MNVFMDICKNRDKTWYLDDFLVYALENNDLYQKYTSDELAKIHNEYDWYENKVYHCYDVMHRRTFINDQEDIKDFVKQWINPEAKEDEIALCFELIHGSNDKSNNK